MGSLIIAVACIVAMRDCDLAQKEECVPLDGTTSQVCLYNESLADKACEDADTICDDAKSKAEELMTKFGEL